MTRLGIIAGGGVLPQLVAEACQHRAETYVVYAIANVADEWIEHHPHHKIPLTEPATLFAMLAQEQITEICFAGHVARPSFADVQIDRSGLLESLSEKFAVGDDALLGELATLFESHGFQVVGVQSRLPDLLVPAGPMVGGQPQDDMMRDIKRGLQIAHTIGKVDVGQAVVVAEGRCLGVEVSDGTEAMLQRVAGMDTNARAGAKFGTGVLVKVPKPGQDYRFDLPSIGPQTVESVAQAQLAGIAIAAEGTLVLAQEEVKQKAQSAGLFIYACPQSGL